jgi:hypothetical protein
MKSFFLSALGLMAALLLPACTSSSSRDPGLSPVRPYIPRVTMPVEANANEQNLMVEVEQVLEAHGLRPTDRTGVDYQLVFSVEDGPVNADVTLELFQGRNRVAYAYARVGGPRIVFQRQRVIREAFDKALPQFASQLPRTTPVGQGYYPGGYEGVPAQGRPDPYGQGQAYGTDGSYPSRY